MPLWIPLTIAAAFLQNMRSTLQKQLTGELSAVAATYVRFAFGLPIAVVYLWSLVAITGHELPAPNWTFLFYCIVGGLGQIWGTALLVGLFAYRNFAVGTTYSKTETVQAALFGVIVLGDRPSLGATAAILVSLAGVIAISMAKSHLTLANFLRTLSDRATLMGIGSGAGFGIAAVAYRAASLSLGRSDFLIPAGFTLVTVLVIQTIVMTIWLGWREPAQLAGTMRNWKVSSGVGIAGSLASIGWFTAMTIENAAYVRALGQIELVFTFASSHFLFREKTARLELAGIALVIGGLLLLLFLR
ncbi:MAG TPA: DMT family transporter [Parvibaculum sp.]|uniref:DMT family transporter n=1 Tax=Parvibaculum sp. TaxID=2024848 RepID=UPI002C1D274C|nr:DMT family transporter [Parvibaculum sp.]HMM13008.1 DMT family transporter [Parvibaculum sp.]